MECPNCKNQVVDGADFCHSCGANLKDIQNQIQQQPIQQTIQQPTINEPQNNYQEPINNNNNKKKIIIISIIVVLVLVIVGIIGVSILMKKDPVDNSKSTYNGIDNQGTSTYDKDGSFLMAVEDVFTLTGKGTVVTGRIERGKVNLNDEVDIVGLKETKRTVIVGIEAANNELDFAEAGDSVGLILKDISREEIARGQVISKPNTIKAKTKFEAKVYVLTEEEGGRHYPFFVNYRPQFYFRTTDVTGEITSLKNVEMVNPGDTVNMTVELANSIAMEVETEFRIREGGKTIGTGVVTKIY